MSSSDSTDHTDAIERITALKYSYFRACDAKDPEAFRDTFVRSGSEIDYGPLGTTDADGMCELFRRVALATDDEGNHTVLDMHHGMHPVITLTGPGKATGQWTLRFRSLNLPARTETILSGEYEDLYVLENGEWKIQRTRFRTTWRMTRPIPPDTTIEQ